MRQTGQEPWQRSARQTCCLSRNYGGATTRYAIGFDLAVSLRPVEIVRGNGHPDPRSDWVVQWEETDDGPVRTYDPDDVWIFGGEWNPLKYVSAKGGDTHEAAFGRWRSPRSRPS